MKIRNVKDVSALLDRRFGSALGRPLSVARTLVWVLVAIYAIGLLVPAPKVDFARTHFNKFLTKRGEPVRDLMLDKNDPRGWKHLKKDPHKFTIAWIGGSTIQTVKPHHYGFLPVDVLHRLPRIDGKPVQVHMYLMEASRAFDLLAATADAVATKPDLIVLDLNPLWLFNPNAIQSWDNLNPAVARDLASDPGNWPLLGALYSPSDFALSLASGHLASIRDRWSYAKKLRAAVDRLAPNPAPPPAPGGPRPAGLELIATMPEPQNFWNYYRNLPRDITKAERYPAAMRQAVTDGSSLTDLIVAQMLKKLGDSKIPAIAYMSAVNPANLADPAVNAALHRVETHLQDIADDHRSPTLLVQSRSGSRLVHPLEFRDMAHLTYAVPMVSLLATMVCSHLTALDPATRCTPEPTPRTTP